jgi:hypothetical protein
MISLCISLAIVIHGVQGFTAETSNLPIPPQVNQPDSLIPNRLFGITLDDVSKEKQETIIEQLQLIRAKHPNMPAPMIRIVLDVDNKESIASVNKDYIDIIQEIKNKKLAFIMAEILDSYAFHFCAKRTDKDGDIKCYLQRTEKCFSALRAFIDVWEIGNEINGQWTGGTSGELDGKDAFTDEKQAARKRARESVIRQIKAAYDFLEDKHAKTALTFYFNDDGERHSWSDIKDDQEYSVMTWLSKYKSTFPHVDYVLISFWPDDNFAKDEKTGLRTSIRPTAGRWAQIFKQIQHDYPEAKVGFGEVGVQCKYRKNSCVPLEDAKGDCKDRNCDCCLKAQKTSAQEYYGVLDRSIRSLLSNEYGSKYGQAFIGGYFYWQFNDDVINKLAAAKREGNLNKRRLLEQQATATRDAILNAYYDDSSQE